MKRFGGALLLIAAFLVASCLADDEDAENATWVTNEPISNPGNIDVRKVLPLVNAVLTELAIKLPDEQLVLEHANKATEHRTSEIVVYVIQGSFSSASYPDQTCNMTIIVDAQKGILNNSVDCAITHQYKIHISISDQGTVKQENVIESLF